MRDLHLLRMEKIKLNFTTNKSYTTQNTFHFRQVYAVSEADKKMHKDDMQKSRKTSYFSFDRQNDCIFIMYLKGKMNVTPLFMSPHCVLKSSIIIPNFQHTFNILDLQSNLYFCVHVFWKIKTIVF